MITCMGNEAGVSQRGGHGTLHRFPRRRGVDEGFINFFGFRGVSAKVINESRYGSLSFIILFAGVIYIINCFGGRGSKVIFGVVG